MTALAKSGGRMLAAIANRAPAPTKRLLRRLATFPPALKTSAFSRACARLALGLPGTGNDLYETNFGISAGLRCAIPAKKVGYVFGQPDQALSERSTFALVRMLADDCDGFLDVGANEGIYTFLIAEVYPEVSRHWFEPDPCLAERLRRNLTRNKIVAIGNEVAVAETAGTATFYMNRIDDLMGSLEHASEAPHAVVAQTVTTVKLSHYLEQHGLRKAFVKIDVEGAGGRAWAGARDRVRDVRYLVMEMLEPEISASLPARIIHDGGYNAYYIRDFDLVHSADGSFRYVEPFWNWLFVRMPPTALRRRLEGSRFRIIDEAEAPIQRIRLK